MTTTKALSMAYLALCHWQPPRRSEGGDKRHEAMKAIEDETGLKGYTQHSNALDALDRQAKPQPEASLEPQGPEPREAARSAGPSLRGGSTDGCGCRRCIEAQDESNTFPLGIGMILCPTCGNKRCPHATDHNCACTSSNDPGQPGSDY